MNSLSTLINHAAALALLVSLSGHTFAEDVVPPKAQSDEQISVWANDASLELFVSQLAQVTGRKAYIEGELEGSVTGRFNGSMADTLDAVGKQFAIVFDVQEATLGVISKSALSSESFALGDSQTADQLRLAFLADEAHGNTIEIIGNEVIARGHPSFVKRVGLSIPESSGPVVASASPVVESTLAATAEDIQSTSDEQSVMAQGAEKITTDTAATEMFEDEMTSSDVQSETASADGVARPILWVTDIPGYETF